MEAFITRQPNQNINGILSFVDVNNFHSDTTNSVTKKIRSFYEADPFPNYEEFDSIGSFYEKARKGIYTRMLDEQIPLNVKILEIGCGTGQLSMYLAHSQRQIVGVDLSLNSLKLASEFKQKNGINNVTLIHADIFNMPFMENSFDFVICKGVLHHTFNCKKAFEQVVKLIKPGGFIILGLYNTYGRLPTWLRKQFYNFFPQKIGKIDYVLKNFAKSDAKRRSWILDQYANPHETWHSADEVLQWFKENKLDYINAIPKITFSEQFTENEKLFQKHDVGNKLEHLIIQIGWIFSISREGALFDIIGRKNK